MVPSFSILARLDWVNLIGYDKDVWDECVRSSFGLMQELVAKNTGGCLKSVHGDQVAGST